MLLNYQDLIKKIKNKESFAFSRWGDGELSCLMGCDGANCDGHKYYGDLAERLYDIITGEQRYYLGLQPKAVKDIGINLQMFFKEEGIDHQWMNADIIHDASMDTGLDELFLACKNEGQIIGPLHLQPLAHKYNLSHIIVPDLNCWKNFESIKGRIVGNGIPLNLFCCGMMANVLIDDIFDMFPKWGLVDAGSAFDVYCGVESRRYHKKILEREEK